MIFAKNYCTACILESMYFLKESLFYLVLYHLSSRKNYKKLNKEPKVHKVLEMKKEYHNMQPIMRNLIAEYAA